MNPFFFNFILSSASILQETLIMLSPLPKLVFIWNAECLVDAWSWCNDNVSPNDSCGDTIGTFCFRLRSVDEVCIGRTGTGWMSISEWVIFSTDFSGCRWKKTGATVIGKGLRENPLILEVSAEGKEADGRIVWAALSWWLPPSWFGIGVT